MTSPIIVGVDEVGRGSLAGPMMAAAVILSPDFPKDALLKDSKTLSNKKRHILSDLIKQYCDYSIVSISPAEIDQYNIYQANKILMIKAVNTLNAYFDEILLDGNIKFTQQNYTSLIKGDTYIAEIAASSIIAKVARDNFMVQLAKMHPLYAWEKNKGYGTKIHIEAIKTFGLSNYHRKSFCKNYVNVS